MRAVPALRILIVDDRRSARRVLRRILTAVEGAACFEAATVEDAIAAIEQLAPDVLLVDLQLSADGRDRSGLVVLEHARVALPASSVVMITDSNESAARRLALGRGAVDVLAIEDVRPDVVVPLVERLKGLHCCVRAERERRGVAEILDAVDMIFALPLRMGARLSRVQAVILHHAIDAVSARL